MDLGEVVKTKSVIDNSCPTVRRVFQDPLPDSSIKILFFTGERCRIKFGMTLPRVD
jgi:hypothetical protein